MGHERIPSITLFKSVHCPYSTLDVMPILWCEGLLSIHGGFHRRRRSVFGIMNARDEI